MSLIDGIKLSFSQTEQENKEWIKRNSKTIRTWVSVYEDTGELVKEEDKNYETNKEWRVDRKGKYKWYTILHTATFQKYKIEIRERHYQYPDRRKDRIIYYSEVTGSLSSNFHGGENWKDLNFDQLQLELDNLEYGLKLDFQKVKIDNVEPSIAIETEFPVFGFVNKNLVSYGNKPFNRYDKNSNGIALGRYVELTDKTSVKVYDKSVEYKLPINLMQYELHFKRMGLINKLGIYHLSDLRDWDKVNSLLSLLIKYFDRVLIYDPSLKTENRLNERQREMVDRGRAFEYWEDLKTEECSNGTYYNRLNEFKTLSEQFGADYHNKIKKLIDDKWNLLMSVKESCNFLPGANKTKLEDFTSIVGCNTLQLSNNNRTNTNIIMNDTISEIKVKEDKVGLILNSYSVLSTKQKQKELRETKKEANDRFMNALSETLKKIAA